MKVSEASWQGQAAATYFASGALRVHATPLDWLLADRDGIVIVRPDLAPAYLANCRRIRCSSKAHVLQLDKWVTPLYCRNY